MRHSGVFIVDDPAESTVSSADLTRCQEAGRLALLAAAPRSIPPENQSLSLDSSFNIIEGLIELIHVAVNDAEALRIRQTESRLELERILVETANGNQAGLLELMAIVVGHRFVIIKHVFGSYSLVGQAFWDHLVTSGNQPLSDQGFGGYVESAFEQVESSLYDEAVERDRQARILRARQSLEDYASQLEINEGSPTPPASLSPTWLGVPAAPGDQATTVSFSVPLAIGSLSTVRQPAGADARSDLNSNTSDLTSLMRRLSFNVRPEWSGATASVSANGQESRDDTQTRPPSRADSQTAAEQESLTNDNQGGRISNLTGTPLAESASTETLQLRS